MSSSSSKPSSKPSKPVAQSQSSPQPKPSSLSSHIAMVELKSRILASVSKLSDRDTYQIAIDDLEKVIGSLPSDGFSVLLSSLLHDPASPAGDSAAAVSGRNVARRESVRLLALLCSAQPDAGASHLPKIIAHIIRRLKDPLSDSSVRDACRDAFGSLATLYLRSHANDAYNGGGGGGGSSTAASLAGLFVKPLLEVLGEQNKTVQVGAAASLAKVVECGGVGGGAVAFQKLCPRICKMLAGQSFLAKGALLSVISSLAQIGAIGTQGMPTVLQSIRECLENSDWATRKSAADALVVLASYSGHLITDGTSQIIDSLEACRFDKVKPVRDSMMEALQFWKKVSGMGDTTAPEDSMERRVAKSGNDEKLDDKQSNLKSKSSGSVKDLSLGSSPTGDNFLSKGKDSNIPENAAVILKKKVPSLKDKELNPEFFQKLETRSSNDVPVEVMLPRRCLESSHMLGEDEQGSPEGGFRISSNLDGVPGCELNENHGRVGLSYHNTEKRLGTNNNQQDLDYLIRDKWTERGFRSRDSKMRSFDADERVELNQKDSLAHRANIFQADSLVESSGINNKGNWLAIQRQLSQLERQQAHLMDMLQDFMGGSHDSLVTLENRVRGLERVVEEMAQDLSISSGRRGGNVMMGFEGSPGWSSSKYNGLQDYAGSKFVRGNEGRIPFSERYLSSDGMVPGSRGRDASWRPDSEGRDPYVYTGQRNGVSNGRRGFTSSLVDGKFPKNEPDVEQVGSRRAWSKGQGPFRLGEGPSARSVWQASKDEATLEAIRVAGDDNGTSRIGARGPIAELDAEITTFDNSRQERSQLWISWNRAMDSLHVGDLDSAYAEVLSTGDDVLLVKLMERSGPAFNELSSEVASELLHAVGQFVLEQSLSDLALAWIQQLLDLIMENGEDFLGIPVEVKKEMLFNLYEASAMELPEDCEGASAEQIMVQLATAWGINIQQLIK
ncbi:hypothetical protein M5K25_002946 [Dendrobium thyrsiflorum]|uniref:Microtubule-associated protein TORTIFOLIA1 n=1 Tax=Dendrobium thyrsiflorum TaxID=117978 RepID=A0ABD0VNR7_DENTH